MDGFIYTAAGGAYKQFAPVPDEAGCAASGGMGRRQDRTGFGQLLDSHADPFAASSVPEREGRVAPCGIYRILAARQRSVQLRDDIFRVSHDGTEAVPFE